MAATPDVVVIGAGPNGLFAACRLARAGLSVTVLEAEHRPGGALWTTPSAGGLMHDVGAAFIAFPDSAAFRGLQLERRGLAFRHGDFDSAHPALDGSCAAIGRDLEASAATFGEDAGAWRGLVGFHRSIEPEILAFLGPLPRVWPAARIGPLRGIRLLRAFASRSGAFAERTFATEAARRVIPAMGLHVDVGPDDRFGVPICWMLALRTTTAGFAIPVGGAGAITRALLEELEAHGGTVRLGAPVDRIVVRDGRAVAVEVDGESVEVRRMVFADTTAPALFSGLLRGAPLPRRLVRGIGRFRHGWGTFKVDYALSAPVPWATEPSRRAAVVHAGESVDDLRRFTAEVRAGALPSSPYLVVGQPTLFDPSRGGGRGHTLYVYTHVPSVLDPSRYPGGWPAWRQRMADRVDERIEGLAPGFHAVVTDRVVHDPLELERMDRNLVGGDMGGGSNAWDHQLVFRPVFPWFRYRTPVRNVYLCSSSTHPGTGVHGMCGWNAAGVALGEE